MQRVFAPIVAITILLLLLPGSSFARKSIPAGKLYRLPLDMRLGIRAGTERTGSGAVCQESVMVGTWSVVYDSKRRGTVWGRVCWDAETDGGSSVTVRVKSSRDNRIWSRWEQVDNGSVLASTPPGRSLSIEVTLSRSPVGDSPLLRSLAVFPSTETQDVFEAKLGPKGVLADIDGAVVTASFDGFFYVQGEQPWGIRVEVPGHPPAAGRKVSILGTVNVGPDGEKSIAATVVMPTGVGSAEPLRMEIGELGGADWNYDSRQGTGQRGVVGGVGTNNIGLLVTITGVVTRSETVGEETWFNLVDASGAIVRVLLPKGMTLDPSWRRVEVTGISSCYKEGKHLYRLLRVRTAEDVKPMGG